MDTLNACPLGGPWCPFAKLGIRRLAVATSGTGPVARLLPRGHRRHSPTRIGPASAPFSTGPATARRAAPTAPRRKPRAPDELGASGATPAPWRHGRRPAQTAQARIAHEPSYETGPAPGVSARFRPGAPRRHHRSAQPAANRTPSRRADRLHRRQRVRPGSAAPQTPERHRGQVVTKVKDEEPILVTALEAAPAPAARSPCQQSPPP
jgi:hypothetical protein